jgi:hypothetical protein
MKVTNGEMAKEDSADHLLGTIDHIMENKKWQTTAWLGQGKL